MQLAETDNQVYFDKNKAREKICAGWLKEQSKAVRKSILFAAIAGITDGLGVTVQSATLAYILQAVIISVTRGLPDDRQCVYSARFAIEVNKG